MTMFDIEACKMWQATNLACQIAFQVDQQISIHAYQIIAPQWTAKGQWVSQSTTCLSTTLQVSYIIIIQVRSHVMCS
jgi:hypothetical protein